MEPEAIEYELAAKCVFCEDGRIRQQWCWLCGGSGVRSTWLKHGAFYDHVDTLQVTPPYKLPHYRAEFLHEEV